MNFAIKTRASDDVQFAAEIECADDAPRSLKIGLAVQRALKTGADLGDANLVDGGQRSDGYRLIGQVRDGALWIHAGCRYLPIEEAREHWIETRYANWEKVIITTGS